MKAPEQLHLSVDLAPPPDPVRNPELDKQVEGVVKAGGMSRLYKVVVTERATNDNTGAPLFEWVIEQCKRDYKAVGLERSDWHYAQRHAHDGWLMTPYGLIELVASDTCPRGHIEWLA